MTEVAISKSAFAEGVKVSPGRVSQWLSEGKIFGDAIVGAGRSAKIMASIAVAQLRDGLDVDHRVRASSVAKLDAVFPTATLSAEPAAAASRSAINHIEQQIQIERLETARRTNRKMAEEEAARSGRYVLAESAAREVGKSVTLVFSSVDGWIAELSSKLSAKFALPQKDVLHLARIEFRNFRATFAAALRQQAEELPELVEDDLGLPQGDLDAPGMSR